MPFNLLIFPIVGGYYILIRCELFRYRQQRVERQKLIFNSIFAGILVLFISWTVTALISSCLPSLVELFRRYYPIKAPFFGTAVFSFFISIIFTELANLIVSEDKAISKAIHKIGNEFELLCEQCYRELEMIQITLDNDKCYVGWMQSLPVPNHSNFISILPVYSGYRNKETKELTFTTQYLDIYATFVRDGSVVDINDLTTTVIKIDSIITATKFDNEMYDRFIEAKATEAT